MNTFLYLKVLIRILKIFLRIWQHGPKVTQLSMKFFLLINVKMPTIVGILTFMSRKNSILGLLHEKSFRTSGHGF